MAPACVNMSTYILLIILLCSDVDSCSERSDLKITTPTPMEALSGSCLLIPCTFKPVHESDKIDITTSVVGIWFKTYFDYSQSADSVISISGNPSKTYPMNITGNLKNQECTTLFSNLSTKYTDKYYFREENSGFTATAVCGPLEIKVKDDPWSPLIQISGELKEKEQVTINCSAQTPCPQSPPKLTWGLKQESLNVLERHTNGTFTTKLHQTITLTDSHDGLRIKCVAVYPVNEGNKMADTSVTLSVTYAPKNTTVSVSPSSLLSAGQLVNLSCSSRAKPPVHSFTWFKMSSEGLVNVSEGDFYSFFFSAVTQGQYYCETMNKVGKQASAVIHLQTEETAAGLLGPMLGGAVGLLILICLAVFTGCFIFKRRAPKETQRETIVKADRTAAAEEEVDTVHYGEIDFSNLRHNGAPDTMQDSQQPEETVYSELQGSQAARTQPTENLHDLYANLNK